jgi:hypothetical protein
LAAPRSSAYAWLAGILRVPGLYSRRLAFASRKLAIFDIFGAVLRPSNAPLLIHPLAGLLTMQFSL